MRALLGGVKRALEAYRRVDNTTNSYPWSPKRFGILMEALTNLNLSSEAWRSARLLRAVPNCRLVLMLAYHMLSPALSIEEAGLMTYLQSPPDAGPSVTQATTGLQNWKCARRQIGGRLPTANQLHQSFIKILSKHFATNKKVSLAFRQKSSTMPMMNPSPTAIIELFTFVEVTLVQYATVAGHFPGVAAATGKTKPKKANAVCAVTPGLRVKDLTEAHPVSPAKADQEVSPKAKTAVYPFLLRHVQERRSLQL